MKILVTGAAGHLGSTTCRWMAENGFEVRATDLVYNRDLPVRLEIANLLDREACYRLVEGVEAVIHLGNHPTHHGRTAQQTYVENVTMNTNVFQAASEVGVGKVIFASSIQAIMGDRQYRPDLPDAEQPPSALPYLPMDSDLPRNPGNPYALSKAVAEQMLEYYARYRKMSCIAIRFPGLMSRQWLARARERAGRLNMQWHMNLDECFSYLTVEDAAALMGAILRTPLEGFRTYMPAARTTRLPVPVPELISRFYANVPLRKPASELTGLVDISKIERETGWSPKDDMHAA